MEISLTLLFILVAALLVAPVAGGLTITDGVKIITRTGNTSPVITITDTDFAENGTITIDILPLHGVVAKGIFTSANIVVEDTAAAATWTGTVTGDTLTLTSSGGNTTAGEKITVTFTGAAGSPWLTDTAGELAGILTATRTDTSETATLNFAIETTPGPGGLIVTDGAKITAANGGTSAVITITDAPIGQYDSIIIDVYNVYPYVSGGFITNDNIAVNDSAAAATWTCDLSGSTLTLTSNGGATAVGENVTVTFTGAGGNPWVRNTFGGQTVFLPATRTDTFGTGTINFVIEITPPPGGLTISDGTKITTAPGSTSPVITIADTTIPAGGTITMDVSGLNAYVASGTLTDANVIINDTAAAATWTRAIAGNTLTLTSSGGTTVAGENITVTFKGAGGNTWIPNTHGEKIIALTAIRTDTSQTGTFNFVIETAPPTGFLVVANFTATPTSELAPLTVTFTDTSRGSPTSWSWDFGDGNSSTLQNPVHIYSDVGKYTVTLTATNAYGSDTKTTDWDYIKVLNGAIKEANTTIDGLTTTDCSRPQKIWVDPFILPAVLVNNSVLEIQPPADHGFKKITFYAMSGVGFYTEDNMITGHPTSVHMVTEEIAPSSGFSSDIGTKASFNYSIDLSSYPCNAKLSTKLWEGTLPAYDEKLNKITSGNGAVSIGTAYSAKITRTNFPAGARAKLHMSVDSYWNPSLSGGPGDVYIWRIADDGTSGQILPTTNYTDPVNNLVYYEADSPSGLSTFGISSLTGSNNPFQMVALVASAVVNQPSNPGPAPASGGGNTGGVKTTIAPEPKQVTPPDPGKVVRIYSNEDGTITQAATLLSSDGLANVSLGYGISARNSSGRPLTSLSITRIPAENLPAAPPGEALSSAGMAYELLPDGATFSPPVPLSFTIPQVQSGNEYVIQEYDTPTGTTGTWQALPGTYNPETGIITVQISHLCRFALFAKAAETNPTETTAPEPTKVTDAKAKIAPLTKPAISTNLGMVGWGLTTIRENPWIMVIVAGVIALVAYFGWWKKRL